MPTTRKGPASGTSTGRVAKTKREGPKRGLSAFMIFSKEERPKVVEENPDIKFGDVGKVLGEKWRTLEPERKKKFEAEAAKDKERYEREKAAMGTK